MHDILVVIHILICVGLIGLVLIQHGKGADMGAAFGSGASSTVFGSQGSGSFLTRATAVLATIFFLLSLILAYFSNQSPESSSVVERVQAPAPIQSELPIIPTPETPATNTELPPVPTSSPDATTSEEVPNSN